MITSQAYAYALCRRPCVHCGRPRRIKDVRTKCVQTAFGAFRFRGRRYRKCGCRDHTGELRQDFPLGEIIPRRTTPEVRYLFAELGARMPYRAASRVLKTCGFGEMRASHMAIRRHTLEIGRELDAQRLDVASGLSPRSPEAAKSLVVGIDDTYVKHRERLSARQFQVTAGRVERNGKLGARFVFVSSNSSWSADSFDGFLLQQGMNRGTSMRVVTDGDDGLRNFVQRSSPRPMESQLDWFHIGMRLELLRKAVVMPTSYQEYLQDPHAQCGFHPHTRTIQTRFATSEQLHRVPILRACLNYDACGFPFHRDISDSSKPPWAAASKPRLAPARRGSTRQFHDPNVGLLRRVVVEQGAAGPDFINVNWIC
jgi:hypothetical protein